MAKQRPGTQTQRASHTRVPNIVIDVVMPLLPSAERDCLLYIVRRTIGFAAEDGKRKERDTISLEQFENGIVSGNYLLDLGTGLSRQTIRTALKGLEEKELVEVVHICLHCYWDGQEDPAKPLERPGAAPLCPRCRRTLARSWALAELTPRKLTDLLNRHDRLHRVFHWNPKVQRFEFESPQLVAEEASHEQALIDEEARLRSLLWYPELVDKAIAAAGKHLKSGSVSLSRRVNSFYRPVVELQEQYVRYPPLVKYALTETLRSNALRGQRNERWWHYTAVVCRNNLARFSRAAHSDEAATVLGALRLRERSVREMLDRAADLNGAGEREAARMLLSDILAQVAELAPLFGDSPELADAALRECFKRGSSDPLSIAPETDDFWAGIDFYPEWSWPDGLTRTCAESVSAESSNPA